MVGPGGTTEVKENWWQLGCHLQGGYGYGYVSGDCTEEEC